VSVSYEIFVPQATDLAIQAHNGESYLGCAGQIHFDGHNGGVRLKRLAGDVSGATVNGRRPGRVAGATWEGGNSKSVRAMEAYGRDAAQLLGSRTGRDVKRADPVGFSDRDGSRREAQEVGLNLGASGPLIHVATVNGGSGSSVRKPGRGPLGRPSGVQPFQPMACGPARPGPAPAVLPLDDASQLQLAPRAECWPSNSPVQTGYSTGPWTVR